MNILVAMNDAYVSKYKVTLLSLCENNQNDAISVYLPYTEDLSQEGIEQLQSIIRPYHAKINLLKFNEKQLKELQKLPLKEWSIEMFFRLFAAEILPLTEDRVLWLDGDIIINQNIKNFYESSFDGNYYIACEDLAITRNKNKEVYQRLNLLPDDPYINTGVLLINLNGLRKESSAAKVIEYALENSNILRYPDQDITNGLFHDKIKVMDGMKYNCQMTGYSYKRAKEIMEKAQIIHFTAYRPWDTDYQRHYSSAISGDIWWKYARMCGYHKEYVKWKIINTIKVKPWQIVYTVYKSTLGKKRSK